MLLFDSSHTSVYTRDLYLFQGWYYTTALFSYGFECSEIKKDKLFTGALISINIAKAK